MVGAGSTLSPAAQAFDSVADRFDERFGAWLSVAAQRRAVRSALLRAFPPGSHILEIGGGTGEDALWLTQQGRHVLLTDPSPTMIRIAEAKLRALGAPEPVAVSAERLGEWAELFRGPFDGVFSNFAALNCVTDLASMGEVLARLVRPGGRLLFVIFGVCAPGEWVVQLARGNGRAAFRRFARGDVPARLGGREFVVRYHRASDLKRALDPWFRLTGRRGIGVFVPPSAAEPWISRHPHLLALAERLDRVASRPLALLGDHVLYQFERTAVSAPAVEIS